MWRCHHTVDRKARATLQTGHTQQRPRNCLVRPLIGAQTAKLPSDVVISVHQQRERRGMIAQERRRPSVDQPAVERHRRQADVVAVSSGVVDQRLVIEVSIGRPVEIGIVDDEGSAQGWGFPALRAHDEIEEMQQGEQPHEATGAKMLDERLLLGELAERVCTQTERAWDLAELTDLPPNGRAGGAGQHCGGLRNRERRALDGHLLADRSTTHGSGEPAMLGKAHLRVAADDLRPGGKHQGRHRRREGSRRYLVEREHTVQTGRRSRDVGSLESNRKRALEDTQQRSRPGLPQTGDHADPLAWLIDFKLGWV